WNAANGWANLTASWTSSRGVYVNDSSATVVSATYYLRQGSSQLASTVGTVSGVSLYGTMAPGVAAVSISTTWVPGTPTSLGFSAVTTAGFTASWTNAVGGTLTNVTVLVGTSCGTWSQTISAGVVTTRTIGTLAAATPYCVGVEDWSASGHSGILYGNQTTLPATPSGLSFFSATSGGFSLTWTNSAGTLANVTVLIGTTCGTWSQRNSVGVVSSYAVTGLAASTPYCVGVQDWSSGGAGGILYGNETTASGGGGGGGGGGGSATSAPTDLIILSHTSTSVSLTWKNPLGLSGDVITYGTDCNTTTQALTVNSTSSYTVTGLGTSTTYCFKVYGVPTGGGTTSPTNVAFVTTDPPTTCFLVCPPTTTSGWTNVFGVFLLVLGAVLLLMRKFGFGGLVMVAGIFTVVVSGVVL
ncbi:MAG: fibronectin type III domain-containing protein, partial [Euryarchaeota archaeon]|nr:fibronectin type III domain-containing protein [Euryarchaeota archaeon]